MIVDKLWNKGYGLETTKKNLELVKENMAEKPTEKTIGVGMDFESITDALAWAVEERPSSVEFILSVGEHNTTGMSKVESGGLDITFTGEDKIGTVLNIMHRTEFRTGGHIVFKDMTIKPVTDRLGFKYGTVFLISECIFDFDGSTSLGIDCFIGAVGSVFSTDFINCTHKSVMQIWTGAVLNMDNCNIKSNTLTTSGQAILVEANSALFIWGRTVIDGFNVGISVEKNASLESRGYNDTVIKNCTTGLAMEAACVLFERVPIIYSGNTTDFADNRFPEPPATDGEYKLSVASGVKTWVAI